MRSSKHTESKKICLFEPETGYRWTGYKVGVGGVLARCDIKIKKKKQAGWKGDMKIKQ